MYPCDLSLFKCVFYQVYSVFLPSLLLDRDPRYCLNPLTDLYLPLSLEVLFSRLRSAFKSFVDSSLTKSVTENRLRSRCRKWTCHHRPGRCVKRPGSLSNFVLLETNFSFFFNGNFHHSIFRKRKEKDRQRVEQYI